MINLYGFDILIESFLNKEISAEKFVIAVFNKNGGHESFDNEEFYHLIDNLCYFADAYTEVDELIGTEENYYIDEDRLRAEVTRIYENILALK